MDEEEIENWYSDKGEDLQKQYEKRVHDIILPPEVIVESDDEEERKKKLKKNAAPKEDEDAVLENLESEVFKTHANYEQMYTRLKAETEKLKAKKASHEKLKILLLTFLGYCAWPFVKIWSGIKILKRKFGLLWKWTLKIKLQDFKFFLTDTIHVKTLKQRLWFFYHIRPIYMFFYKPLRKMFIKYVSRPVEALIEKSKAVYKKLLELTIKHSKKGLEILLAKLKILLGIIIKIFGKVGAQIKAVKDTYAKSRESLKSMHEKFIEKLEEKANAEKGILPAEKSS